MPVEVNPDLQVAYHGKPMKDPHIIVARLAYRGRRDLPSTAFDQDGPLRLDVGIGITALLHSAFTPSKEPTPKVRVSGKGVEIGPSLIRKKQEMEFVILADGPNMLLDCYGPLTDVKIRPQRQEEARYRKLSTLRTISGWACLAFVIWWVIEQPAAAADLVHNIETFFASL
jgi:hypothetical protein